MHQVHHITFPLRAGSAFALLAALFVAGCATSPHGATVLEVGDRAELDGVVTRVDMSPWTYDGNARVDVATTQAGAVTVELPARWNLCKAAGIDTASTLAVGQRVHVAGRVTSAGTIGICEDARDALRRLP